MAYTTTLKICFDDCDPGGLAFFANVFKFSHRVFEEFVEAIGIGWSEWYNNPEWAVPVRSTNADYSRPLWMGREYEAHLYLQSVKTSSFTIEVQFREFSGELCCRVQTTHVFLNKSTLQKQNIPAPIKEKLAQFDGSTSEMGV